MCNTLPCLLLFSRLTLWGLWTYGHHLGLPRDVRTLWPGDIWGHAGCVNLPQKGECKKSDGWLVIWANITVGRQKMAMWEDWQCDWHAENYKSLHFHFQESSRCHCTDVTTLSLLEEWECRSMTYSCITPKNLSHTSNSHAVLGKKILNYTLVASIGI